MLRFLSGTNIYTNEYASAAARYKSGDYILLLEFTVRFSDNCCAILIQMVFWGTRMTRIGWMNTDS
jgi:hypothetical protein